MDNATPASGGVTPGNRPGKYVVLFIVISTHANRLGRGHSTIIIDRLERNVALHACWQQNLRITFRCNHHVIDLRFPTLRLTNVT